MSDHNGQGVGGVARLGSIQRCAVGVSVLLGLMLAGYGAVGSYATVSALAARRGVPLPGLVPVGLDGGLVGVVALDLVLTWTGQPLGWLRQLARLITMGTVAANAAAGYPDPVAVGLHSAAPVMLLAMVEAARAVLLRRMGVASGTVRDRIPWLRWVLSPWRTWLIWRRMVLWQVTSYRTALDTELRVRYSVALLRTHYGHGWKREAPSELVWMLRSGVYADEACTRVYSMTAGKDEEKKRSDSVGERLPAAAEPQADKSDTAQTGSSHDSLSGSSQGGGSTEPWAGRGQPKDVDGQQWENALRFNEQYWTLHGRPASAERLREHLGVGSKKARVLTQLVRAADRAAVCNTRMCTDVMATGSGAQ